MALDITLWDIWLHVYLFLPAALANMAPVLCKRVFPWWDTPLDCGARLFGKRILGDHKTVRGLVVGLFAAGLVAYLQSQGPLHLLLFDYTNWALIGGLLGIGALGGDMLKSFVKRQFGVKPGRAWFPYDQIDFALGAIVMILPVYWAGWTMTLALLFILVVGHLLFKQIGTVLGIE